MVVGQMTSNLLPEKSRPLLQSGNWISLKLIHIIVDLMELSLKSINDI